MWESLGVLRVLAAASSAALLSTATLLATGCCNPQPPSECALDSAGGALPVIESLTAQQRVYEHIELRGSGFGEINDPDDPCVHQVVFSGDDVEITVENVYVWRDDYIRVRVPVGATIDGSAVPIPKTPLLVSVRTSAGTSDPLPFQVITSAGTVAFLERTNIANSNDGDPTNDEDISTFLGDPPMNLAQTKDGEIGDFDNDGRLDIFDANSGNVRNETYPLIRYGRDSDGFDAFPFERRLNGEPGTFLLATNDVYIQDAITYDLDAMDLNNDLFLDLVQATQEDTGSYFRVFIRRADDPRRYDEQTFTWMGTEPFGPGRPDDLDHIDADRDGFVDLVATLRFNGEVGAVRFFHNNSGESFDDWVSVSEEFNGQSVHDAFFVFANSDALPDIGFCSEVIKSCAVSINTGDGLFAPPSEFGPSPMITGAVGDFNGDGIEDLTVAGGIGQFGGNTPIAYVLLNNADGDLDEELQLPYSWGDGGGAFYDIEVGDVDLDGDLDIIAAVDGGADEPARRVAIWYNSGAGQFTEATALGADQVLVGLGPYERISVDLIDFDNDGDLDLYVTGGDPSDTDWGMPLPESFGRAPNQFFENRLITTML